MTERLYELNPELDSCTAKVLKCEPCADGFWIQLDRTVLFPEGGGQLCDRGSVNGMPIESVIEENGRILHLCSAELPEGSLVEVCLDREVRDNHSRQHTGEHILSHSFWKLFHVANVGFHSSDEMITIDLDGELTRDQCLQAECYANEQIWSNKPVRIIYRDKSQLSDLNIRKITEKTDGTVRIVAVEDGDICTCCGTHVASTGCIGMIKIVNIQRHRGGMRIDAVCGRQALLDYSNKCELIHRLSCNLSCGTDTMESRIESLKMDVRKLSSELHAVSARLMDFTAIEALSNCSISNGIKCVMVPIEGSLSEAKQLIKRLTLDGKTIAGVFFHSDCRIGYMVCKTEDVKISCREVSAIINGLLNGKGGGSDSFAQGSGKYSPDWKDLVQMVERATLRMIN